MRNYILSDFRPINDRQDAGAVMENYAHSLLQQKTKSLQEVKYWRTKSKAEVDFILEENSKPEPFEVKYSSKKIIGKSLHSFLDKFHPEKAIVFTKDFIGSEEVNGVKIIFVPVSYF